MFKRCLLASALVVAGPTAHAAGLDASISDKSAQFVFLTDSSSLGYGGADIGFGVLFNEDSDLVGTANLLVTGSPTSGNPFQFGVGAKAYVADLDIDETASAIALGGLVRYVIPGNTPVGFAVEGYLAPSITSFSKTESFRELMLRAELEVMPSTRGYIGYRWMETRLEDIGKYRIDDNVHVGIRVFF